MFKTIAIIAATVAVAATGPAFAAGQVKAKVVQKNGQTVYCIKEQATGSLVPVRTCLTKEAWEARGSKVAMAKKDAVLASNASASTQN